jgi:hypothetical protein
MKPIETVLYILAQVLSLAASGRSVGDVHRPVDPRMSLLSSMLSGDAEIYFPGSEGFTNGTLTLAAKKPQLDALVRVATVEDVQNTVREEYSA